MTWVRIDDGFLTHPKVLKAGLHGRALWLAALVWSARERTDGLIGPYMLAPLAALADIEVADVGAVAERLVEVGLFEPDEGGYRIHDYLDYNPSAGEVDEMRKATSEARSEAGKRGARARWGDRDGNHDGNDMANGMATDMANGIANGWQSDSPVPDPVPHTRSKDRVGAAAPVPLFSDEPKQAKPRHQPVTPAFLADMQAEHPDLDVRGLYERVQNLRRWDGYKDKRRGFKVEIGYEREKLARFAASSQQGGQPPPKSSIRFDPRTDPEFGGDWDRPRQEVLG